MSAQYIASAALAEIASGALPAGCRRRSGSGESRWRDFAVRATPAPDSHLPLRRCAGYANSAIPTVGAAIRVQPTWSSAGAPEDADAVPAQRQHAALPVATIVRLRSAQASAVHGAAQQVGNGGRGALISTCGISLTSPSLTAAPTATSWCHCRAAEHVAALRGIQIVIC